MNLLLFINRGLCKMASRIIAQALCVTELSGFPFLPLHQGIEINRPVNQYSKNNPCFLLLNLRRFNQAANSVRTVGPAVPLDSWIGGQIMISYEVKSTVRLHLMLTFPVSLYSVVRRQQKY